MLGRMLLQKGDVPNGDANGVNGSYALSTKKDWKPCFEEIDWVNPNEKNLVAEGECISRQLQDGELIQL